MIPVTMKKNLKMRAATMREAWYVCRSSKPLNDSSSHHREHCKTVRRRRLTFFPSNIHVSQIYQTCLLARFKKHSVFWRRRQQTATLKTLKRVRHPSLKVKVGLRDGVRNRGVLEENRVQGSQKKTSRSERINMRMHILLSICSI